MKTLVLTLTFLTGSAVSSLSTAGDRFNSNQSVREHYSDGHRQKANKNHKKHNNKHYSSNRHYNNNGYSNYGNNRSYRNNNHRYDN